MTTQLDVALADVDARRAEGDETVDLRLLVAVGGRSDVEVQPVLPGLRRARGGPPQVIFGPPCGDRIAVSSSWSQTNGQPSASLQKYPTSLRPVARDRADEPAVGEEAVARLDDAELVALGVGEHDVPLLGALTDVDVPGAELERPRHRLLLVLEGGARQVEVDLVRAGLRGAAGHEPEPEPGVVGRHERDAVACVRGRSQPRTPDQKRASRTGPARRQQSATSCDAIAQRSLIEPDTSGSHGSSASAAMRSSRAAATSVGPRSRAAGLHVDVQEDLLHHEAQPLVRVVEQVDQGVRGPLRAPEQPHPRRHRVAGAQLGQVGQVVLGGEARVPLGAASSAGSPARPATRRAPRWRCRCSGGR